MLRDLLILLLLLSACCGAPQSPDAGPPDPVIDDPRSVLIRKECPDKSAWVGTGHILDNETVATANHVVMCSVNKTYGPYDVEPTKLELNGANITALEKMGNDDIDLAFIHYYNHHEPLVVGHATSGERVCIYPATPKRGQVCGYVFSNEPGHEGVVMFMEVVGGNSGSVIFNQKNEAVGIVTSRDFLFSYGTSLVTIGL